jgi:hypothetical protein
VYLLVLNAAYLLLRKRRAQRTMTP